MLSIDKILKYTCSKICCEFVVIMSHMGDLFVFDLVKVANMFSLPLQSLYGTLHSHCCTESIQTSHRHTCGSSHCRKANDQIDLEIGNWQEV